MPSKSMVMVVGALTSGFVSAGEGLAVGLGDGDGAAVSSSFLNSFTSLAGGLGSIPGGVPTGLAGSSVRVIVTSSLSGGNGCFTSLRNASA